MVAACDGPTGAKKMTNFWSRCLLETSLMRSLITPVPEPSIDFLIEEREEEEEEEEEEKEEQEEEEKEDELFFIHGDRSVGG